MLRVSATTTETTINLQGINGDPGAAATGVQYGSELMAFAEALAKHDEQTLTDTRQALLDAAGDAVLVDAAGVAGNFQRMVRIADSMGIPVDNMQSDFGKQVREELDLARFESARNSLG